MDPALANVKRPSVTFRPDFNFFLPDGEDQVPPHSLHDHIPPFTAGLLKVNREINQIISIC